MEVWDQTSDRHPALAYGVRCQQEAFGFELDWHLQSWTCCKGGQFSLQLTSGGVSNLGGQYVNVIESDETGDRVVEKRSEGRGTKRVSRARRDGDLRSA
jgi:hypothetical protein